MDLAAGPAAPDVALAPLVDGARRYDFYQLVELLHRHHGDDLEGDREADPAGERVRFQASASLGFPGSDILSLTPRPAGHYDMRVSFLGLQGAQSPLPGYYLEAMAHAEAHREGAAGDFLNLFNHRVLSLLHRGWRKYRHHVRYQDGAADGFSAAIFALVGLADDRLRGETPINWSKMLAYAGLLAGRSRSPDVVAGIVGHCFDLDGVEVESWVHRRVEIPPDQRTRTGLGASTLGQDMIAGSRVDDISGKFALCLHGLDLERFRDFLPDGRDHQALRTLMEFVLREPLAYDLELELLESEVRPMRLGEGGSCQLGWTTFVQPEAHATARRRRVSIQMTR
ncbi:MULTISPECIES: type VI secretion system baseplate subunit TssG [Halomonas]|uniref:Type VI secretion protein n=1 Tax=Halomonas halophila TaxID=29573 RepID=A0ABQ0U7V8_9GAMM|nr:MULTISPECIES: type VI secretion system baseplate subunit TssG [Halomonas]MDR5890387.1 type VI secretion system baseplate subunit TssG [Halomonas salina]WJY08123.1 type VI secretion system baseplate subunit TssG [Halomonas halophila]GEK74568.1 type VI secretion protein [Halomonas halophila]